MLPNSTSVPETPPEAPPELASCRCMAARSADEKPPRRRTPSPLPAIPSVTVGLMMAFFPKCPVCWAAYLSVFGIIGAERIPRMAWLYPLLAAVLGLHLLLALKRAPQTGYGPFALSVGGALTILLGRHFPPLAGWGPIAGFLLLATGSLWDSLSANRLHSSPPH